MCSATQGPQLLGGLGPIGWFAKASCATCQRLVGPKDQPSRQQGCDRIGLGARQMACRGGCIYSPGPGLDCAFVDSCRPDFETQAGRRENLAANVAPGRKHQRLGGKPKRHGLRHWMPAPLTQEPHHGGGGLFDRAARHVDRRPIAFGA